MISNYQYKISEILNKPLLEGDNFMPLIVLVVHLLKTKKKSINLCTQEIQIIFTRAI